MNERGGQEGEREGERGGEGRQKEGGGGEEVYGKQKQLLT